MKPERWEQVERLYHSALERKPEERVAYLAQACGGDEELRREVAALLAHDTSSFIEAPALEVAAQALAADTAAVDLTQPAAASMAGRQVGAYRLLAPLGRGGMGEVHLALDTRLGRQVAVKLLPAEFTSNADRLRRFAQEARAVSSLNHPNIVTIHEVGQAATAAGVTHYIVTEYVEGETLRRRLEGAAGNRMKLPEALGVAAQMGEALAAAHEAGIVHRDIKPENVMVRRDGYVKVLDFGLAKLAEPSAPAADTQAVTAAGASTEAGAVLGTPRYMSPEQARGERVDARTDIFSLGVTLYEMVAGRVPFTGATTSDVIAALLKDEPPPLAARAPEAPPELERILGRALCKDRAGRYQQVNELIADLKRLKRQLDLEDELAPAGRSASGSGVGRDASSRATMPDTAPGQAESTGDLPPAHTTAGHLGKGLRRHRWLAAAALALIAAGAGWLYWRGAQLDAARAAVPRIEELARAARFFEAYDLAVEAQRRLPHDPTLAHLMRTIADDLSVASDPPGARVYLRRFAAGAATRQLVGVTPIEHRQIARGSYLVSIEKEGYAGLERTVSGGLIQAGGTLVPSPPVRLEARLVEAHRAPARMAFVPGGDYRLVSWARPTDARVRLGDFFIDRYEVTNREYKEFVSAGGYLKREFWRHPLAKDGRALSWEVAIGEFTDQTGLPGPRSWKNQDFPEGKAEHPVTDITWYEAAAYAAFRGKELPTVFQWEKAARDGFASFAGVVMPWGLFTEAIEGRANFDGRGTLPAESLEFGMSPYGCYHMAGNVAEWCRNEALAAAAGFATAGGAWDDPPYLFGRYGAYPGFYTSGKLGFRCVVKAGGGITDEGAVALRAEAEVPTFTPAPEANFRAWQEHYRYAQPPLDAQLVEVAETADWRREKVTYVGAEGERAIAYLYLPKHYPPPWQVIQFIPADGVFNRFQGLTEAAEGSLAPFIKSGRAGLAVVLKGFREREWPANFSPPARESVEYRDLVLQWMSDERRGLDYALTRGDLDAARVAYIAFSSGSSLRLGLPAVEPRYRAVIWTGAVLRRRNDGLSPEINPANLIPHVRAPKLLLHGRYDETAPLKPEGEPLHRLLRGPKRILLYDGGHIPAPEFYVPAINGWLDETLGPVARR